MHSSTRQFLTELLKLAALIVLIVIPIRLYVAQPFVVSGSSMAPSFESGEYLIVDQLTYRFENARRGDVVIFRYPKEPSTFFIKRIIGLPGDTVTITNGTIRIRNDEYPEGFTFDEPYLAETRARTRGTLDVTLDENEYFVLGDNRGESSDSRLWGALPEDNIIGRALVRLFPLTDTELFPGAHTIEAPAWSPALFETP